MRHNIVATLTTMALLTACGPAHPASSLTAEEMRAIDPSCGLWVMDGDGHGGRWDSDIKRVHATVYPGDRRPPNGNFTLLGMDPTCLKRTDAQWAAIKAEKRRAFDAEWETVYEDQCSGSYRHRTSGAVMGSAWCFAATVTVPTATKTEAAPALPSTVSVPAERVQEP